MISGFRVWLCSVSHPTPPFAAKPRVGLPALHSIFFGPRHCHTKWWPTFMALSSSRSMVAVTGGWKELSPSFIDNHVTGVYRDVVTNTFSSAYSSILLLFTLFTWPFCRIFYFSGIFKCWRVLLSYTYTSISKTHLRVCLVHLLHASLPR
jgi:hypothetical protein